MNAINPFKSVSNLCHPCSILPVTLKHSFFVIMKKIIIVQLVLFLLVACEKSALTTAADSKSRPVVEAYLSPGLTPEVKITYQLAFGSTDNIDKIANVFKDRIIIDHEDAENLRIEAEAFARRVMALVKALHNLDDERVTAVLGAHEVSI